MERENAMECFSAGVRLAVVALSSARTVFAWHNASCLCFGKVWKQTFWEGVGSACGACTPGLAPVCCRY